MYNYSGFLNLLVFIDCTIHAQSMDFCIYRYFVQDNPWIVQIFTLRITYNIISIRIHVVYGNFAIKFLVWFEGDQEAIPTQTLRLRWQYTTDCIHVCLTLVYTSDHL